MTAYFDIPIQFRPALRLLSTASGVDREAYAHELVRAVYTHRDEAGVTQGAEVLSGLEPWETLDPAAVLSAATPGVAAELKGLIQHVDESARHYLFLPEDPLVSSETSCLSAQSGELPPGTVVWTRTGQRAVVQFAFPFLGVDVATAVVEDRSVASTTKPPAMRPPTVVRMATVDAKSVIESASDVASSVSWALPPPWNVGVTAGLSVLQMILHSTDAPAGPSPIDQLKTDLEAFIGEKELTDISGNFAEFTHQLGDRTAEMTFQPQDIDSLGQDFLHDFQTYVLHDSTGALRVSDNVTHLIGQLQGVATTLTAADADPTKFDAQLKDAKEKLDLICTGVTLWMTGMKAVMQVRACAVAKELATQDVARYVDDDHSWWSTYHSIRTAILGKSVDGVVVDAGWATEIGTWIDQMRSTRLAMITDCEEAVEPTFHTVPDERLTRQQEVDVHGFRFVDSAENDEWKHFRGDTNEGVTMCSNGRVVAHDDKVRADRAIYVSGVNTALDAVLGGAARNVSLWKARLLEFEQLASLPGPAVAPQVVVQTSGTATPSGGWVDGAKVEYSVMYVNDAGPSDGGAWSSPVDIGGFAFAALSAIPQCTDAKPKHLWLVRRITGPDGVQTVRTVKILDPGVTTYLDTHP